MNSQLGIVLEGKDRALTKWRPNLTDPKRATIGFQIVTLKEGLYLDAKKRKKWPKSMVFIEPSSTKNEMTVLSVPIAQSNEPVRFSDDINSAVIAIIPLSTDWTVQIIASYAEVGTVKKTISDAFKKGLVEMRRPEKIPQKGTFFVHGTRDKDIPWVSAVCFEKRTKNKTITLGSE